MGDVTKLPTAALPYHTIPVAEMYAQPEPADRAVWAVCPYLRRLERCRGCPRWEAMPPHGTGKRGCRGLAEEAVRYAMAGMARQPTPDAP